MPKVLVAVMLAAATAQPMLGCDLCAVYAASRARGETGAGPFAGVAEQFTHFGTVQLEGHEVPNPIGQYLDSSISQVFAGYNFNERFGVQFNLPVIYRSFKRSDDQGGIDHGTESGVGDAALVGTVVVYRKLSERSALIWDILGGVKFPTGSTDRLKEEFEEADDPLGPPSAIHGHDLALGSGSYDGVIGTRVHGRLGHMFADAMVQYAIRSKGDHGYRFADDLTWSGGPGYYLLMKDDFSLGIQAVASGEYKGTDEFQGTEAEDTGVTAVYFGPQVNITWGSNLSAQAGVDLPLSVNNTSLQAVPDYRVRVALIWHF